MQWRFLPFTRLDAFENMAVDEAVFRATQRKNVPPTLRFYSWTSPAVSLGYFQDIEKEVNVPVCRHHGIDIVRRPTGGKAVLHEGDVTYAVVANEDHPLFPKDILGTYRVVSQCIAHGLALLGIQGEMSGDIRAADGESLKSVCFSTPSRYELLVNNRKICGSAQVRSRGAFLQHGSILMDFDPLKTCRVMLTHIEDCKEQVERLKRSVTSIADSVNPLPDIREVCRKLETGFEKTLGIQLIPGNLTEEEEALKKHLMTHKYMNPKWNMEGGCRSWISEN